MTLKDLGLNLAGKVLMHGKICFGGSENLALGGHLGLKMCQDGAKIMPT